MLFSACTKQTLVYVIAIVVMHVTEEYMGAVVDICSTRKLH